MNYFRKSPTVFCSVCSTERELPKKKLRLGSIAMKSFLWAALWGVLAYLIGGVIAAVWIAFLSAVLCFLVLEVYDSVKFKRELVCPVCQFDPLLYRRSPEQATQRCLESLKGREEAALRKWQASKQMPETFEGSPQN